MKYSICHHAYVDVWSEIELNEETAESFNTNLKAKYDYTDHYFTLDEIVAAAPYCTDHPRREGLNPVWETIVGPHHTSALQAFIQFMNYEVEISGEFWESDYDIFESEVVIQYDDESL